VGWTWIDIGVMALSVVTLVVVMLFAFLLWRDGYVRGWRAARAVPPTCPQCGYNLSGLSQCRCPECGATYELDKLWRASIHIDMHKKRAGKPAAERQ